MSRAQRLALLGVGAVVAVVGFALAGSLDEDEKREPVTTGSTRAMPATDGTVTTAPRPKPARPRATRIRVRGGQPVGGVTRLRMKKGETVRFTVSSDVAEQVHVHGYDIARDVAAGGSVRFAFKATLDGIYEIELEHSHVQIARLEVRP